MLWNVTVPAQTFGGGRGGRLGVHVEVFIAIDVDDEIVVALRVVDHNLHGSRVEDLFSWAIWAWEKGPGTWWSAPLPASTPGMLMADDWYWYWYARRTRIEVRHDLFAKAWQCR